MLIHQINKLKSEKQHLEKMINSVIQETSRYQFSSSFRKQAKGLEKKFTRFDKEFKERSQVIFFLSAYIYEWCECIIDITI